MLYRIWYLLDFQRFIVEKSRFFLLDCLFRLEAFIEGLVIITGSIREHDCVIFELPRVRKRIHGDRLFAGRKKRYGSKSTLMIFL